MIPGRPRCSEESLGRDEPLLATASLVSAWMLIEQPGAWGPDALTESDFPDGARPLVQRAGRLGIRTLLIRRRATQGKTRTVCLAHSGSENSPPVMRVGSVADPTELVDLDLEGMADGRLPEFGSDEGEPLYLVCTHGRHDICCADKGRPLFRALSEHRPVQTWESSHVGGDRFAGNLVALPRGDYFGRVEPGGAADLVDAYETGRLDLDHYRGRSIQPRLAQAAERFLRAERSLPGFEDIEQVEYRRIDHDHAEVVFRDLDRVSHRVRVAARTVEEPDFLTCRAEEPGQPVGYVLQSITTV